MQLREKERCIQNEQIHLVAPWRDHGIGGALIKDIIARAQASGRAVELSVMRGNPAIRLYNRLGFRLVGEDPEKLHMRRKATAR